MLSGHQSRQGRQVRIWESRKILQRVVGSRCRMLVRQVVRRLGEIIEIYVPLRVFEFIQRNLSSHRQTLPDPEIIKIYQSALSSRPASLIRDVVCIRSSNRGYRIKTNGK